MRSRPSAAACLLVVVFVLLGGGRAEAQTVRVEAGGGWAVPSSEVNMSVQGQQGFAEVDPGSGAHAYAAVGLVWTVSDDVALEGRLRVQQSQLTGSTSDFGCDTCTYSNAPNGRLRGATVEGQIILTSVGRINPYFLVGLGVVRTSIDGVRVTPQGEDAVQFSEVNVMDAGGDVGVGAALRLAGGLSLTAETRVTGSLPGGKENFVTTFPFSLGLAYHFGRP